MVRDRPHVDEASTDQRALGVSRKVVGMVWSLECDLDCCGEGGVCVSSCEARVQGHP